MLELDHAIFHFINSTCANGLFDWLAPFWREKWFWLPFYTFLVAFLTLNFGKRGWLTLAALVLTVGLADQISSELVKKNVRRPRPCNDFFYKNEVHLRLADCGAGYSFPSSHAANHFAAAVFLSLIFSKKRRWVWPVLLGWAASISLAQVYVGVHFPLDIFCGAILGAAVGALGFWLSRKWATLPSELP